MIAFLAMSRLRYGCAVGMNVPFLRCADEGMGVDMI